MATKKITLNELRRLVKKVMNENSEPRWREDNEGTVYITMDDGREVPFYFSEDDGEGTTYHASGTDEKSTLKFISDDGAYEAFFSAYSATGNPDDPEYGDLEFLSLRDNFLNKVRGEKFVVDFDKWAMDFAKNGDLDNERSQKILRLKDEVSMEAKLLSINTNGPLHFYMEFSNGKKAFVPAECVMDLYSKYVEHHDDPAHY